MTTEELSNKLKSFSRNDNVYFRIGNMRYPVIDIYPETLAGKSMTILDSKIREVWKDTTLEHSV